MIELYLWSIPITWIAMMIGSWFDTKPRNITVEDFFNSTFFSCVPIVNVVLAALILWYAQDQNKDVILFGSRNDRLG